MNREGDKKLSYFRLAKNLSSAPQDDEK